jgi:hypothetical protein
MLRIFRHFDKSRICHLQGCWPLEMFNNPYRSRIMPYVGCEVVTGSIEDHRLPEHCSWPLFINHVVSETLLITFFTDCMHVLWWLACGFSVRPVMTSPSAQCLKQDLHNPSQIPSQCQKVVREKNMAMSPVGSGNKNECAGETKQQFTLPNQKSWTLEMTTAMFTEIFKHSQRSTRRNSESRSHARLLQNIWYKSFRF